MDILSDHEFSAKPISPEKSCIFLDGIPTHKNIEGVCLELCVRVNQKYLVFMTDDIPSEDMLHIHLLDDDLNIIDSATIGGVYSTGSFKNYNLQEPDQVIFHFIGGNKWRVEILESKAFCLPFISSPKGVCRKKLFYQYFKLYGNPQPEMDG